MNVDLTYPSGQQFMSMLFNFTIKVLRSEHGAERIRVVFKEKDGQARAKFSLPRGKARQLAYAILTACASEDVQPIEFGVDESPKKAAVA